MTDEEKDFKTLESSYFTIKCQDYAQLSGARVTEILKEILIQKDINIEIAEGITNSLGIRINITSVGLILLLNQ